MEQYDSSMRSVIKVANAGLAPEYALKADMEDVEKNAASLEARPHMADKCNGILPTNTKIATWVSAVQFLDKRNEYGEELGQVVEGRIKRACSLFGILPDYEALDEHFNTEVKQAAADAPGSGILTMEDGSYPIANAEQVKQASDHLLMYVGHYNASERLAIGRHIIKSAEHFATEADDRTHRVAGLAMPRRDGLLELLADRTKRASTNQAVFQGLEELAAAVKIASPAELVKMIDPIVGTVTQFDKLAGLTEGYNRTVRIPEDFLYGDTVKQASTDAASIVMLGGEPFDARKLAEQVPPKVFNVLGLDVAQDLKTTGMLDPVKIASILPTLPLPDRNLLYAALRAL